MGSRNWSNNWFRIYSYSNNFFSAPPSPVQATATVTVSAAGTVNSISIGNSGFGYIRSCSLCSRSRRGADEQFRALGIATIRSTSIKTQGTIGIGSTSITGVTTTNVVVGDRVRLGIGYSDLYNFIPADTFVTQLNQILYSLTMQQQMLVLQHPYLNLVEQTVVLLQVLQLHGGGGYLSPPNVTISNEVSEKNYINFPGISTATGISL